MARPPGSPSPVSVVLPLGTVPVTPPRSCPPCSATLSLQTDYSHRRGVPATLYIFSLDTQQSGTTGSQNPSRMRTTQLFSSPWKPTVQGESARWEHLGASCQAQVIYKSYDSSGFVYQVSPPHSAPLIKKTNSTLALCPPQSSMPGRGANAVNYLPSCSRRVPILFPVFRSS